jgi:hypothetical protein
MWLQFSCWLYNDILEHVESNRGGTDQLRRIWNETVSAMCLEGRRKTTVLSQSALLVS